jgi:hypothetical protein
MLPNLLAQQSTNPTSDAVETEMTKISNHARRAIGVPNGIEIAVAAVFLFKRDF